MARIKVDISGLTRLLDKVSRETAREISKSNAGDVLEKEVVGTIKKGNSPVQGFRRFPKYSESYRDQIRGKAAFFTKNGKVIPLKKQGRRKTPTNSLIDKLNEDLKGKKRSPVNLTVTGEMLKSFFVRAKLKARSVIFTVGFADEVAEFHNEGKGNLPVRRMIPTGSGETFKRVITRRVNKIFQRIVDRVAKRQR